MLLYSIGPRVNMPHALPHRWFQKRIHRYSYIICDTHAAAMLSPQSYRARRGFDKWIPSCTMPPLLPSLLANSKALSLRRAHSRQAVVFPKLR